MRSFNSPKITKAMNLNRFVALAGSLLTMVQIWLITSDKDGLCFSDGCEIVDSLTKVPPVVFNVGGFLFFQAVFWGIFFARQKPERLRFVKMLLLAGLAAEGVLVSFQHFVVHNFCTYCLVILAFVVLLNLLAGLKHVLSGLAVFTAVVLAFSSLQFSEPGGRFMENLDAGTFAELPGQDRDHKRYLFISSTCKHCEQVIASISQENSCAIGFNPIDKMSAFPLQDVQMRGSYSTAVNRTFLKSLGIDQVPVLLVVDAVGFQIVKGEAPVRAFLAKSCTVQTGNEDLLLVPEADLLLPGLDDSCNVDIACDEEGTVPAAK